VPTVISEIGVFIRCVHAMYNAGLILGDSPQFYRKRKHNRKEAKGNEEERAGFGPEKKELELKMFTKHTRHASRR